MPPRLPDTRLSHIRESPSGEHAFGSFWQRNLADTGTQTRPAVAPSRCKFILFLRCALSLDQVDCAFPQRMAFMTVPCSYRADCAYAQDSPPHLFSRNSPGSAVKLKLVGLTASTKQPSSPAPVRFASNSALIVGRSTGKFVDSASCVT